jgi:hypothetical protein
MLMTFPIAVPMSPLPNFGNLPSSHLVVVEIMGWEGRRTFVWAPVVTKGLVATNL